MIQHALRHDSYLDVAKYYEKVWETSSIKEDTTDKGKAVRSKFTTVSGKALMKSPGTRTHRVLHRSRNAHK